VLEAFAAVCDEHEIPDEDVHAFVDAMASDIETDRYETYDQLESYMDGSAAAVGRMMTAIMELDEEAEVKALPTRRSSARRFR